MSQNIYNKNIDHRIANCRHARLREALQFRPNHQQASQQEEVKQLAEAYVVYEAPAKEESERNRGLEVFRAVVTFVFACVSFLLQPI